MLSSCSTTRVLSGGERRLSHNEVTIKAQGGELRSSDISPYIKQQPGNSLLRGWNPFIYVYNWGGKSDSGMARFCRKIGAAPLIYDSRATEASVESIKAHLEYLGYFGSKVTSVENHKGKVVSVNYIVVPGKKYTIGGIDFDVPQRGEFNEDFAAWTGTVNSSLRGTALSEKALEEHSAGAASHFRRLGYFDFNKNNFSFVADTLGDGTANLKYRVREYTRNESSSLAQPIRKFYIGKVEISHSDRIPFRESVLRGLNTIKPGQLYDENNVNTTYNRLSALRVFSGVRIEMNQSDTNMVDCHIRLSESPVQGFKVNAEASTNSSGLIGLSPQVRYFHKNLFHGAEWFNLSFSGNFQFKLDENIRSTEYRISSSLSFPRFFAVPYSAFKGPDIPRTEFNISFSYQDRPEYTRDILSTSYGYSGEMRSKGITYQIYPLQLNFVRLFNLDPAFSATLDRNPFMKYTYQDHLDAGTGTVIYYNSSREIVPKGSYDFSRLSFDLSGNVLSLFTNSMKKNSEGAGLVAGSPFTQYVRGEWQVGFSRNLGGEGIQQVALRFLAGAGYAYGNSSALPFEKKFYAGGASSMRGWQARALGPGYSKLDESFIIPSQTGDIKLEANLEYRFKVFWKIDGALFVDVGNVWNFKDESGTGEGSFRFDDFYNSLAADWGTGIRFDLDFILLRVDVGFKVRDPSLEQDLRLLGPRDWFAKDGFAIHFGVGYPF